MLRVGECRCRGVVKTSACRGRGLIGLTKRQAGDGFDEVLGSNRLIIDADDMLTLFVDDRHLIQRSTVPGGETDVGLQRLRV